MIKNIVGALLRIKYKLFAKYPPINVVDQLRQTTAILIYMPNRVEDFGAALKSLEKLRAAKPKWKVTVITKLEMVGFIDKHLKVDIIPYSKEDLSFLGLPRDSLRKLFASASYDLALDLKIQFDILTVILFQLSGAPLRVSFDSTEKSPFYNFGIRVNTAETLTHKYNSIIKYITAIAGATSEQKVSAAQPIG